MSGALPPAAADAPLEWTYNPWRQNRWAALFGAMMVAAGAVLIMGFGLPPLAVGTLTAVFIASVHVAILPTRCRVDDEGVARRLSFVWSRRPWSRIRKACLGRHGLYVTTAAHPGTLAAARGLLLPLPAGAPSPLVDELRRRLAQHDLLP